MFTVTVQCLGEPTRAANGRPVRCTRRMTGRSASSAALAEQACRDRMVLDPRGMWAVERGDWDLFTAYGVRCPGCAR